MSPRLAFAIEAAFAAGRSTLAHFQTLENIEMKADATPVTIADKGAERLIREKIAASYPGETVLGEEEGLIGVSNDRWVVDPIDGTKSFVAGVPLYSTLLSYEVDAKPILGVAYFPALDEMYYAEVGGGAFCNGRPIHVSGRAVVEGSLLSCGGLHSMATHGRMNGFLKLSKQAMATRTWCDAYGHALVASGRIDGMMDPIVNRWDISALVVIVEEAGGKFTNFIGQTGLHDEAISSNPAIHSALIDAFK